MRTPRLPACATEYMLSNEYKDNVADKEHYFKESFSVITFTFAKNKCYLDNLLICRIKL